MNFFYISELKQLPTDLGPLSLTIGNFDGIHLGHQQLLQASLAWSQAHGGQSVALTFDPHPVAVLNPQLNHSRLFSLEDQREQMRKLGFRGVFLQPFTTEFQNLSAEEFLNDFILNKFQPRQLVVGYDFGFGKNRSGQRKLLEEFCLKNKIELQIVPPFSLDFEVVSTSSVRESLSSGNIEKANRFLGRPYSLCGKVIHGAKRGSAIGFPTANLSLNLNPSLKKGVYCTRVELGGESFPSVTNVGINPTVSTDAQVKVETHIFNFDRQIYQEKLKLEFLKFLREEKKFSSLEELKSQIQKDSVLAKEFFK